MNNWNNNKNMIGNAVQEIKLQKWQHEKQQYESIVYISANHLLHKTLTIFYTGN